MRRGTKVFLSVFVLFLLALSAMAAVSVWYFTRPEVVEHSLLLVDLSGSVSEYDSSRELRELFGEKVLTVSDLVTSITAAKDDERIVGLVIRLESPDGLDMAKSYEIRSAIEDFRKAGKPTHVYLEEGSTIDYYVASACENVYLMPSGQLWTTGFYAAMPFFRGSLDKLHIRPNFYAYHEYKSATDPFRRRDMSGPDREQLNALLDNWWNAFLDGVAASRKIDRSTVEAAVDASPLIPEEARSAGLVDALLYWDQVKDRLDGKVDGKDDARFTRIEEYRKSVRESGKHRIAVVYATGTIVPGESGSSFSGGDVLGSDTISRAIRKAREDDSIDAIVLRVDSPGGSAYASDQIWREVMRTREAKKPIVVSMSWLAASGGYWISMAADKIVADPTTVTGSIGVVAGKLDWSGFYTWIGTNWEHLARGKNAGLFTDIQGFTPTQEERVKAWMTFIYDDFVRKVAQGRNLPEERVQEIARGRVWSGEAAKEIGLVDSLGGLREAISVAKQLAGIPASDSVRIVPYPRPQSLWESLFGRKESDARAELPAPLRETLAASALWERLRGEPVLALDPELLGLRVDN